MEQKNEHTNKLVIKKVSHGRTQTSTTDYKEVTTREKWVNFGIKNDFPQELERIYKSASAYHKNLVDKRAKMIAGAGFDFSKIISPQAKVFFQNKYGKKTLDKITKFLAFDISLFGGGFLCIKWSAPNEAGERMIAAISNISFSKVRAEKRYDDDCVLNWYVSRDWLNISKKENKPEWYAGFDAENLNEFTQILPVFIETPGMDYYPLPIYNASLDELKSLLELGIFHLKSIQNGFSVEHIFIHPGIYDEQAQDEVALRVREQSGPDNAGESMHIFPGNVIPGLSTQVIPVQRPDTDRRYLELKDQLIQEVIAAHGATSPIAGREVSGKLGSADEIADAYKYFQLSEINDNQKLIEDEINMLAAYNNIQDQFILNKYNTTLPVTTNTNGE